MDLPLAADPTDGFRAKGVRPGQANAARARSRADDLGPDNQGSPGKPVGAVVAAAKVLRTLHASERPLNASEVARAAGLHRGTAYNILRTLQAEGFVGYDDATRSYSVSLTYPRDRLWRFAAQRVDGFGAPADACGFRCARRVGLSLQGLGTFVAAAVGLGRRGVPYRSLRDCRAAIPRPGRRLGRGHGGLRKRQPSRARGAVRAGRLVSKAVLCRFPGAGREARQSGFAVDRGTMFQGITQLSVPVLSPSGSYC